MFHSDTTHQCQHKFFIGQGRAHSCHLPGIPVEALYPIGGVDYGQYLRDIIKVGCMDLGVSIVTHKLECLIVLSHRSHISSFLPYHLNGVITLSGTEHITQVCRENTLAAIADLDEHIALEMGYTSS